MSPAPTKALTKATARFNESAIDDEVVVMLVDSGEFFSLIGTGRAIWSLIDGTRDSKALLADLAAAFEVEPAEIAADVDAFVAQLRGAGLLEAS